MSFDIAAAEIDLVFTFAAEQHVGRRRIKRDARVVTARQIVRQKLEEVVAFVAEQNIRRLTVESAAKNVVAFAAENPILRRTAEQSIIAGAAENDVASSVWTARGKIVRRAADQFQSETVLVGAKRHEFVTQLP